MKLFQKKVMISINSTIKQLVLRKSHFALSINIMKDNDKTKWNFTEKKSHRE